MGKRHKLTDAACVREICLGISFLRLIPYSPGDGGGEKDEQWMKGKAEKRGGRTFKRDDRSNEKSKKGRGKEREIKKNVKKEQQEKKERRKE